MKTQKDIVDKFFELSKEAYEETNESIYEELGVSKEDYLNEKLKMIKRNKLKAKVALNKAKNENMLNYALQKIRYIIKSSDKKLKENLEQLILQRSPQFQFRNIEKLDKNDLSELLGDLNIIEIIEELEKSNNANK